MTNELVQTNVNTQSASQYKANIDASIAALAQVANQFAVTAIPAPQVITVAGGALASRTYYVRTALHYGFGGGDAVPSPEIAVVVPAGYLLRVLSPEGAQFGSFSDGWSVYVSTTPGTETKQNTSTTAIGTYWTEPTSGLIIGASWPSFGLMVMVATGTAMLPHESPPSQQDINVNPREIEAINVAHASLPRIDRIYWDGNTMQYVAGTAASSPVAPAIPVSSHPIAQIYVAAAVTSLNNANITDERVALSPLPRPPEVFYGTANPTTVDVGMAEHVGVQVTTNLTITLSASRQGRCVLSINNTSGSAVSVTHNATNITSPLTVNSGKSTYLDLINLFCMNAVQNV